MAAGAAADDGTRIGVHVEIPEEEAHRLDAQRARVSASLRSLAALADALRPRLEHEVERRLGRAPHAAEAALVEHLGQARSPAWAPSASPTSWLSDAGVQSIVEPA